jgi:nucleoside-diphosphate-sugar epimerase
VESLEGRVVLVTGAGGFIGRVVVKALLDGHATVRALHGPADQPSVFTGRQRLTTHVGDITDMDVLREAASGADTAVHLAGPPSVQASFDSPAEYARAHVAGAAALLDVCRQMKVRRVVHISSAEVYGRASGTAVREDHPLNPRSPYAAAKIGAEQFVRAFTEVFGVSAVILRPFSVYGPGLSAQSLVGAICRMARSSEAIVVNDLAPVRDFCFVEDVADAVVRACVETIEGVVTCNVGVGRGTSIADLAESILRLVGRRIPIRAGGNHARPGNSEIYRLVADTSRAWEVLQWRALTSLEEGLERTLRSISL